MEQDNRLRNNLKHTSEAIGISLKATKAFKETYRTVVSKRMFAEETVERYVGEIKPGHELVD